MVGGVTMTTKPRYTVTWVHTQNDLVWVIRDRHKQCADVRPYRNTQAAAQAVCGWCEWAYYMSEGRN